MHHQAVGIPERAPRRVEDVEFGRLLGVEAEHRRSRAQTDRDRPTAGEVEAAQPELIGGFPDAVDALPQPFQHTGIHGRLEAAPGEVLQDLCAGGHPPWPAKSASS